MINYRGEYILRIFTIEEKEIIDTMYKNGDRIDDIRTFLHCNEGALRKYLKDNGYKRRKRNTIKGSEKLGASRKHHFNENYFKYMDSEDKAYWLGFLYADGNVSWGKDKNGAQKGCTIELSLCEKDEEHLYKFLKCIDADDDYPLEKRSIKLDDKTFTSYRLSLNSVIMGKDLENLGCIPNKSFVLRHPDINEELLPHFIRGYFDGDGCVSFNKELKNSIYTIIGTEDILQFIKDKSGVSKEISVRMVKRDKEYKNFYQFSIGGLKSKLVFHEYIYNNAHIYLDRKYVKSCEVYDYLLSKNSKVA